MYFSMAWREEPFRSFSDAMAALIMSRYGGCSAGFAGFLGFAAGLALAGDFTASDMLKILDTFK